MRSDYKVNPSVWECVSALVRWLRAFQQAAAVRCSPADRTDSSTSANSSLELAAGSAPIGAIAAIVTIGNGAVGAAQLNATPVDYLLPTCQPIGLTVLLSFMRCRVRPRCGLTAGNE